MAIIRCPKNHAVEVANESDERTINGITVTVRSVHDVIQRCGECGWFEVRDGVPIWPDHPIAGRYDNVVHLVAGGACALLRQRYPREDDRVALAEEGKLPPIIRAMESDLRTEFSGVNWAELDFDSVVTEVEDEERLHVAM
jgi:hypothetical protein